MGKRQPARMTPFNYVSYGVIAIITTLIIFNVVKNIIIGYMALVAWALLSIFLDLASMKSKWVHDWVNGKPTILIRQGKIMEENLAQVRLTGEELLRELRSKNAFRVADVEFALMESTGAINVMLKSDNKPLTPRDLGQKVSPQSEPQTVILDGNIINESLANMGLNKEWLETQLAGIGITLDNVFIGQVDTMGDLYVDLYSDNIQIPQPKVKELLYANLEKCHADLTTYALQTTEKETSAMYSANAEKLQQLLERLEPYLIR
jgi:uncharacterized membrane protein YcaP (DUF421 family)